MSGREPRVETATCGGGWRATSAATPIVNRERIRALELSTNAPTTPEMLFDSALELTHESGVTLRFHAEDALREWVALDLPAVKVAAAETWTRAHVERFGDRDARGNDESTATGTSEPSTLTAAPASSSWNSTEKSASYDWTFTTPYGKAVVDASGVDPAPSWTTTERRIDRAMLTERDPIQMYDELTLYESELDDNGVAHLGLKVRAIMPKCWYVLLRFWLRVDGVLIRLRETRFFCDTTERDKSGAVVVVRETQHREETWDALRARGARASLASSPTPTKPPASFSPPAVRWTSLTTSSSSAPTRRSARHRPSRRGHGSMTHHRLVVRASSPISFSSSHTTLTTNEMSDTFPPQRTRRHPPSPDGDDTPRIWTGRDSTPTPPPRLAVDSARARALARAGTPRRPMASTVAFSHALSARAATSVRGSNDKKFTRAARPRRRRASRARSWCVRIDATERERMDRRCDAWGKRNAREREREERRERANARGERARELFSRVITGRRRERGVARGDGWMRACGTE